MEHGVAPDSIRVPATKDWINFDSTVGELQKMLNAKYHSFEHASRRSVHVGTEEYYLPEHLSDKIDFVVPGTSFSPVSRRSANFRAAPKPVFAAADNAGCDSVVTPDCIRSMYGAPNGVETSRDENRLAIYETYDEKYAQDDLDGFFAKWATYVPQGTKPKLSSINGGNAPNPDGQGQPESALDFQQVYGLTYPQAVELYQVVDSSGGLFEKLFAALDSSYCQGSEDQCGVYTPAAVMSVSWGSDEATEDGKVLKRQCDEVLKLGLQGFTVVASSGDDGVGGNNGGCLGQKENIFNPGFPATCPYVTAVGSTTLTPGSDVHDTQVATFNFSSGGGFSNLFDAPDFQTTVIASFFEQDQQQYKYYNASGGKFVDGNGKYNRKGRGFPDVSAVGDNIAFYFHGEASTTLGTSASAPIFASLITLINDQRLKAGKNTVGYINAAMYKNPSMFTDVTVGMQDKGGSGGLLDNGGCGTTGFHATKGWDPVSGLGTPKYQDMLDYFMNLQ